MSTTYMRLVNFLTINKATITTNAAGQRIPTFTTGGTYRCAYRDLKAQEDVTPTMNLRDQSECIVEASAGPISYDDQIVNICDRYGNVLEAGPMQILDIHQVVNFSGQPRHIILTLRVFRPC